MKNNSDKDYAQVIVEAYDNADIVGQRCPDVAWLFVEDAYHWPNPHYKGEPVCNPDAGPDCKDGQQFNPKFGPTLKERYLKHQQENK